MGQRMSAGGFFRSTANTHISSILMYGYATGGFSVFLPREQDRDPWELERCPFVLSFPCHGLLQAACTALLWATWKAAQM